MTRKLRMVDLFAGAGGASTGASAAGVKVVWAGNHWPEACEVHAWNHPRTLTVCQDLHQANWAHVPAHDILWASPCCQGSSKARGKERPHHDNARATAWAVVSCAEFHRPPFVVVENVPEFLLWDLYPAWVKAWELLGYTLQTNVLNAADFGVPQSRERLFITATRDGALALTDPGQEHVPCSDIIDWRKGFLPIKGPRHGKAFGPATLARIARGREQFGDRYIVAYYGAENGGRSIDKPLGTLTTRDRFLIVSGDKARFLSIPEARAAMGFPDSYQLPRQRRLAMHLLGNAVCPPVAADIVKQIKKVA